MSGTGEARLDFAGEERLFRIRLGEIRRIEEKCKDGIGEVLRRLAQCILVIDQLGGLQALAAGIAIRADDVRTIIYEGLVGGGMPSGEATKLVRREIDDRGVKGLMDNAGVAFGALYGASEAPEEGDAPGEPEAAETPSPEPTSEPSTE
jgi:hypothetical protein